MPRKSGAWLRWCWSLRAATGVHLEASHPPLTLTFKRFGSRWNRGVERTRKQSRSQTRKRVRAEVLEDDEVLNGKRARPSEPGRQGASADTPLDADESDSDESDSDEEQAREDWGAEACVEMSSSDESEQDRRPPPRAETRSSKPGGAEKEATSELDKAVVAAATALTKAKQAAAKAKQGERTPPTESEPPRKASRSRVAGWSLHKRVAKLMHIMEAKLDAEEELHPVNYSETKICCACDGDAYEVPPSAVKHLRIVTLQGFGTGRHKLVLELEGERPNVGGRSRAAGRCVVSRARAATPGAVRERAHPSGAERTHVHCLSLLPRVDGLRAGCRRKGRALPAVRRGGRASSL